MIIQIPNLTESEKSVKWTCRRLFDSSSDPWSISIAVPVTTVTITPSGINNVANVAVGVKRTFSCTTGSSRPAAWIQWYIGRENVTNKAQPQTPQPDDDKFISSSRLVFTGKDEDHNKNIYCEAINIEGRDPVKSTEMSIYIQKPVTTVSITPRRDHNMIGVIVGDSQSFMCTTDSSRPAARIQWYIGGVNVTNQAKPQTPQPNGDKFISSSRLVYTGKDQDHNKTIYCESVNIEGRDKVKSTETSIYIQIPPTALTITPVADSNVISIMKGGTETFNCTTNSCRPAARILWYIGTLNVTSHAQQQTQQLDGDKFVSSSRLVYQGKDDDHNKTIYCEAVTVEGKYKVKSRKQFIYIFSFKKTYTKSSRSDEYSDLQASNPAFQDPYTSIHDTIVLIHMKNVEMLLMQLPTKT
ncbi:Hypothetical predicted protein [Mytilus galloprovincialis]|uniref:Ig-like domain-containing protein n=1 Tax=Mytilus galloprovincialis TaxID=29158 RepID=A0A8B6HAC9_MYTGA|nr:Hypothetical predicted protein [Mytilus galloprovincialis]